MDLMRLQLTSTVATLTSADRKRPESWPTYQAAVTISWCDSLASLDSHISSVAIVTGSFQPGCATVMRSADDRGWFVVVFTKTLLIFHGTVFGSIVIVMLVIVLTHR